METSSHVRTHSTAEDVELRIFTPRDRVSSVDLKSRFWRLESSSPTSTISNYPDPIRLYFERVAAMSSPFISSPPLETRTLELRCTPIGLEPVHVDFKTLTTQLMTLFNEVILDQIKELIEEGFMMSVQGHLIPPKGLDRAIIIPDSIVFESSYLKVTHHCYAILEVQLRVFQNRLEEIVRDGHPQLEPACILLATLQSCLALGDMELSSLIEQIDRILKEHSDLSESFIPLADQIGAATKIAEIAQSLLTITNAIEIKGQILSDRVLTRSASFCTTELPGSPVNVAAGLKSGSSSVVIPVAQSALKR
ncbi:MAG: hypothetical protein HY860_02335 [Chlamydiales bacterium]|nr:hypothetical protein [Chlamydiales bacterium]